MKRWISVSVLFVMLASLLLAPMGISAAKPAASPAKTSDALVDALAGGTGAPLNILVQTESQDYAAAISTINAAGGQVTRTFKYASGLAATVPPSAIEALIALDGVGKISLDTVRTLGPTSRPVAGATTLAAAGPDGLTREAMAQLDLALAGGAALPVGEGFEMVTLNATDAANYPTTYWNPISMNAYPVWDDGYFGEGSLVAVIDTGIYDQHPLLVGNVVGGVDLSPDVGTPEEGWNLPGNHWHGSHVSGIIAGHGGLVVPEDHILVASIEMYSGMTLPEYELDPAYRVIPMYGMAPDAQLYGIKVFPSTGAGVPESYIIGGIEHAIDMKVSGAYDIDAINMSIGGPNWFDGRDLEDQVVDSATSAGIAVAASASNDGPYSQTIQSPGTANTSIAVGSVANPVNTRVYWDYYYNWFGIGYYLYVDDNPQMIYSSSRGPTSDGRDKPTVAATGVYVLSAMPSAGNPDGAGWASGTSMAAPAVAGIVALLNGWGEAKGASPYDYKEAVIAGAHPLPGFDKYDQGAGYVDAAASMAALMADATLGSPHPDLSNGYSRNAVKPKGTSIQGANDDEGITFEVSLAPGMSEHYYFQLHPNAEKVIIDFTNVDYGEDPLEMNSFEVYYQGGMRSGNFSQVDTTNVWGDAHFEIADMSTTASGYIFGANLYDMPLMPAYQKFIIENDWTSYDTVSATVTVRVVKGNGGIKPDEHYDGALITGESYGWIPVGFGPNGVRLDLSWQNDWKRYPPNDMDMIVVWYDTDDNQYVEYGGATMYAPEIVIIDSDMIAEVYVLVDGYNTNDIKEKWELDVWYR